MDRLASTALQLGPAALASLFAAYGVMMGVYALIKKLRAQQ